VELKMVLQSEAREEYLWFHKEHLNLSNQGSLKNHFIKQFFKEPIKVSQRTFKKWFFKAPCLVPQRTLKAGFFKEPFP